jgi:predicted nucleotidyltransferase
MEFGTEKQRAFVQRFVAACEKDERVVAAFLGGSFASGKADEWSDLDIYVVTTDEGYAGFFDGRLAFMQGLGQAAYLEDFNGFGFDMVWFTFADGVEGELSMAPEGNFDHIHGGAYVSLVDKRGLLAGKTFPMYSPTEAQQLGTLHKQIYGFWEALSHFIAAIHRKQPWTAYGSLDEMRMACLKLLRLKHDFTAEHTAYSKAEQYVSEDELRTLAASCCSLEYDAMLAAALALVQEYQRICPSLAAEHGITYPADLERVLLNRFEFLCHSFRTGSSK